MMKRLLVLLVGSALAGLAFAQQYKWVDQNGRTQYGDNPPPGVKATPLRGASAAPTAPASPGAAAKGPAKPLTPAEQEAAFRDRQKAAQKAADKAADSARDDDARKENCARAQEYLRSLESGVRIAITGKDGERFYLEDDQRASETAKARQMVQQSCT
jgi:hypothetical protein